MKAILFTDNLILTSTFQSLKQVKFWIGLYDYEKVIVFDRGKIIYFKRRKTRCYVKII